MEMLQKRRPLVPGIILSLMLTGCAQGTSNNYEYNGPGGPLFGEVSFKGQSLNIGFVRVQPASGRVGGSDDSANFPLTMKTAVKDGKYRFERVPAGEVRLCLQLPKGDTRKFKLGKKGDSSKDDAAEDRQPGSAGKGRFGDDPTMTRQLELAKSIPIRYGSFDTANLSTTIQDGKENVFNISLEEKASEGGE